MRSEEFRSRVWAPLQGRIGLGGSIGASALLFAAGGLELGIVYWGLAGVCAVVAVWCGSFTVLVVVSDGQLRISAGGVRVMRTTVERIERVAPVVDLKDDWGSRHLFGLNTVFDGRVQAVAGLPVVQINAGRRSVVASVRDWERLVQVVQELGAELDGRESVGVRSYIL
ncbi:hypothetical protein [Corynebacterium sp.]|uniref:hypothetical protein n=1 Tax=Corynebacterium sp. TaxID=1720 RepID=UPI0025C56F4F|nr:hypothetical protein [Corynebacterium sp.]